MVLVLSDRYKPLIEKLKQPYYKVVFLSEFFNIEKGCRQEDPIAAYLFIICAEILQLKVNSIDSITGIKLGNTTYKMTRFADDTTMILDGTSASLLAALNTLEIYCYFS